MISTAHFHGVLPRQYVHLRHAGPAVLGVPQRKESQRRHHRLGGERSADVQGLSDAPRLGTGPGL